MDRFPDQHDLISFFESEPTVLDAGVVWAYNHLEFRTVRGRDEFLAVIEPGSEAFLLFPRELIADGGGERTWFVMATRRLGDGQAIR